MGTQMLEWLRLGGPAMLLLAATSVAALALIIIKAWEFSEQRLLRRDFVEPALAAWHSGRVDQALLQLNESPSPLAEVMAAAIVGRRNPALTEPEVREQVAALAAQRLMQLRGLFRALEAIGTLAPLLGLLGTVLGMIEAFQQLHAAGARVDPSMLSGGIWQALLTTAAGLAVAIPVIAVLHAFERVLERLHADMESALTRIFTRPIHSARGAEAIAMRLARSQEAG